MINSVTEQESFYSDLEKKSFRELLEGINNEDKKVPFVVEKVIPVIEELVTKAFPRMKNGGRLFYIGAGTSGRLGVLDASEIPPTFGMEPGTVIGIIAGGDYALRSAVEDAEDDPEQAWKDLMEHNICDKDILVGIAASGRTPYVIGGLKKARENEILTASIAMTHNSEIGKAAEVVIEAVVGPEFVTGSTRMKAGTAQKMILNMISTSLMIKLGHVKGNRMIDMQLTNQKLVERGAKMIMEETGLDYDAAKEMLLKHGSVRNAVKVFFDENV